MGGPVNGERILQSHERMTLTESGGKTELVLEATGTALQPFAAAMLSGMRAGWNQSFQILDEVLRGVTYRHGGAGQDPFDVTVTFDEFMGSCILTLRAVFVSAQERDRLVAEVGAKEGGEQTLGRLEAYLKS
jgi:uncharacterized protein YndB with AHSA1/START domain